MRVDNHIGIDTFGSEGQVFLSVSNTTCTLLSVTTSELITDHGDLDGTHLDFHIPHLFLVGG